MENATPIGYIPKRKRKQSRRSTLIITLGLILIVISMVGYLFRDRFFNQSPVVTYQKAEQESENAPDFSKWQFYQDPEAAYSIRIPPEWTINQLKNNNNTFLREVTFQPSEKGQLYGSIEQMNIKVINESDNSINYPKTQQEYKKWLNAENNYSEDTLLKVDTDSVQNEQAVIFLDKARASTDGYYLNAWIRRNNLNYYISVAGNKNIDIDDIYAFKYLLQTIQFN